MLTMQAVGLDSGGIGLSTDEEDIEYWRGDASYNVDENAKGLNRIKGLTSKAINCENGSPGFNLIITRKNIDSAVVYNSCLTEDPDDMIPYDVEEEQWVDPVTIDDFAFPAGYTNPDSGADNTCEGGFNSNSEYSIFCQHMALNSLSEGWLNLAWIKNISFYGSTLSDITNLSNLSSVGQLYLEGTDLTDLSPLKNLLSAKDIWIGENGITTLDGLQNLEELTDLFANDNLLTNVDQLSNITGEIDSLFFRNNNLENINGLSGITSLYSLALNNNNLTNVDGLENLDYAMNIYLENNNLNNVDGLSNLKEAEARLYLQNNSLTNLDGLSNLTTVGDLYLTGNPLTNLDGLQSLTKADRIDVASIGLRDISSLSNLESVEEIYLVGNPDLNDISSLNNITSIDNAIYFDDKEYDVKLDANSYICQNFSEKTKTGFFFTGDVVYSNICKEGDL